MGKTGKGKKRPAVEANSRSSAGASEKSSSSKKRSVDNEEFDAGKKDFPPPQDASSSPDDSSSSDEEDDDLVLEGEIMRMPGTTTSDEELSSEEEDEDKDEYGGKKARKIPLPEDYKKKSSKKQKKDNKRDKSKSKRGGGEPKVDTVNVDFIFCDMDEKFFYGIKTLLLANPVYAPQSSALSDLMIDNVSVGTVVSAEGYAKGEDDVFAVASVLNVTTHSSQPCIQYLRKQCLDHCPSQHKEEMETVLSGKTKRPAGFFLHGRMINMPLEICEVLHQQLVLDMDWAVKNAEGGEDVRKSLDYGAFVVMAPCTRSGGDNGMLVYKYFDDEVFASNAEFMYTFDAPKSGLEEAGGEKQLCSVIVMTKTGHRDAMNDLAKLIHGAKAN
mmetsp:Transcript_1460/g.2726  ORF Transcript_1460/g.2726 Transcript_1460/m.2726 type:complete len:385 (-) Transcript_1460:144-1298(-)